MSEQHVHIAYMQQICWHTYLQTKVLADTYLLLVYLADAVFFLGGEILELSLYIKLHTLKTLGYTMVGSLMSVLFSLWTHNIYNDLRQESKLVANFNCCRHWTNSTISAIVQCTCEPSTYFVLIMECVYNTMNASVKKHQQLLFQWIHNNTYLYILGRYPHYWCFFTDTFWTHCYSKPHIFNSFIFMS